jgi:hypothetical protein
MREENKRKKNRKKNPKQGNRKSMTFDDKLGFENLPT